MIRSPEPEYLNKAETIARYQKELADRDQEQKEDAARNARQRKRGRTTLNICTTIQGTDSQFLSGSQDDDGFGNDQMSRQIAYRKARAAGFTPTGRYISQIADELGDPKAWFSHKADVKRVCEERGYSCDGSGAKVKARPVDGPDPWDEPYRVADDIVQESVEKELAGQRIGTQERMDLEESTRRRFSAQD